MLVTRLVEDCAAHPLSRECKAVTAVAPALRAPLMAATHVVLYGAAVQAWAVTHVNSGFIFQARRGTELPATGALLAGSLAACAWLIVSMVLVGRAVALTTHQHLQDADVSVDAGAGAGAGMAGVDGVDVGGGELRMHHLGEVFRAATAAMVCMLAFFVAPWPEWVMRAFPRVGCGDVLRPAQHPPNSTRRFMLAALGCGVCAPAYRVRMMDFFFMDQIMSQAAALRDVLTVILLACGTVTSQWVRHAPVVALLPGWLRLVQVLRRFRDDGNLVHLINAGKYAAGIVAVTAGLCLRQGGEGGEEGGRRPDIYPQKSPKHVSIQSRENVPQLFYPNWIPRSDECVKPRDPWLEVRGGRGGHRDGRRAGRRRRRHGLAARVQRHHAGGLYELHQLL
jgi:hypothetical protein